MSKFHFCPNLRQDLNIGSVNVILMMLITVVSVFDKSSDEKMSEMSCDEYPVRTKQKKIAGKRRAES